MYEVFDGETVVKQSQSASEAINWAIKHGCANPIILRGGGYVMNSLYLLSNQTIIGTAVSSSDSNNYVGVYLSSSSQNHENFLEAYEAEFIGET
jgi:hypothetical protein